MRTVHFENADIPVRETAHRDSDDLLTAGLGLIGLRGAVPATREEMPDANEIRRRAIHSNWNGIAWLGDPAGGWESRLASPVAGREFHALLHLPSAHQPHRVLLQLPDGFDPQAPRLLVVAASGSRGVYGAMALAAAWGLPRGFAVITTDKGCGSDWFDVDSRTSPGLDGLPTDDPSQQAFRPDFSDAQPHEVLLRHLHSQDNPEAHWGEHLHQARRFAWRLLAELFDVLAPAAKRRTLLVGLSNGGAAVLQAARCGTGVDGAVAVAPNAWAAEGGRAFFDYAREAALWMPLAQTDVRLRDAPCPLPPESLTARAEVSRQVLHGLGLLHGSSGADARSAYRHLRRCGWPAETLAAARITTAFGFWDAAVIGYAQALSRQPAGHHPLGVRYAMLDSDGRARAATPRERALWWSDGAGIAPGAGVGWVHTQPPAQLLHAIARLNARKSPLREGLRATRCGAPDPQLPLLLVHGSGDGLIPPVFSSEPWHRQARRHGAAPVGWRVDRAAHFDAHLGLPGYAGHYRSLLPAAFAALDSMWARIRLA